MKSLHGLLSDTAEDARIPADTADRARRTATGARARNYVAVAVMVLVAIVGTTTITWQLRHDKPPTAAAVPAPQLRGPGVPLIAGVVSPAGTLMVGPVFATKRGLVAIFQVVADPYTILRAFGTQLAAAGYRFVVDRPSPCERTEEAVNLTEVPMWACGLMAVRAEADGPHIVSIDLHLSVSAAPAMAALQFSTALYDPAAYNPRTSPTPDIPAGAGPQQPFPQQSPAQSRTGERLPGTDLLAVAGTALAVPAMPGGCSIGYLAVLVASPPAEQRAADYVAQYVTQGLRVEAEISQAGRYTELYTAGGGDATVSVGSLDGADYILLHRCPD